MKKFTFIAILVLMIIMPSLSAFATLSGDIDNSGSIDLKDVILPLQLLSGINVTSPVYLSSYVDGNERIGLAEVIYVLQSLAQLRNYPIVLSVTPASATSDVAVASTVTATFNEELDISTVTTTTFTLKTGTIHIPGTVTYSGKTATFISSVRLSRSTTYTATITTGVRNKARNPLAADYTWNFTTAATPFAPYMAFPTGSWPEAVAIGDVNNDGRNDVVMTTSFDFDQANDYKLLVFLQKASGRFDPPIKYSTLSAYGSRAETVAIGDINHDGKDDVVIGNSGSSIEVFLQNASGGLNPGISYATNDSKKIRIADLNNDGLLDIVGIGWGTSTASVWMQNASGTLNAPVIFSVTHGGSDDLEVGDVNNDGLTDIIVMSGQLILPNIGVLMQKSDGTFNPPVYYSVGSSNILTNGAAVGDINGDNWNDIVVTYGGNSPYAKIGVFLQNGAKTLDPVSSYSSYDCPEPVEINDVDGDGRQDVVVAHGGGNVLGVYLQGSDGKLEPEMRFPLPYATHYNPHGLAVGDINGDGLNDVVLADYNNGLVVLYGR